MNDYQRRKLNTYQSELAFMKEHSADFPKTSAGGKAVVELDKKITQILALAGEQQSNTARRHIGIKGDKLQELIEILRMMNRASNALADEVDGIENLFRMPRKTSTAVYLATARTFYNDSAAYEKEFKDYELPATFRADLQTLINDVESASNTADAANASRAGATGGLRELFAEAGKLSNKLDAVVRNKYRADAQKLAAWTVASHVEAAPRVVKTEENAQNKK